MSSPEALLRRYLRQRLELGETEVVLDRFSPDVLGALLNPRAAVGRRESIGTPSPDAQDLPPAGAVGPTVDPAPAPARDQTVRARIAPSGGHANASSDLPGRAAAAGAERTGSLDELRELAVSCLGCSLCESRSQVVFGEGDPHADIMVVGEAPGSEEDRTGRPFVGRAGKLLDRFLESIGSPRDTVYICNVLKCRPPGNRNPRPAEIEACSGYLRRQVELVDPVVILAVGTFPAQTLLATEEPIGRLRGRVHDYGGRPLIPTYHPAAVLRNPSWIRPVWDDLQRLREVLASD